MLIWIDSNLERENVIYVLPEEVNFSMRVVAKNGNLDDIVKWLSKKNIIDHSSYCTSATAEGGYLEVLKHLRQLGCLRSEEVSLLREMET